MRHVIMHKVRPPNVLARAWYRRIGDDTTIACSTDPVGDLARLVPYRFRRFHQIVAALGGYFWMPCMVCAQPFGGHESGLTIPDPTGPHLWLSICSECSKKRARVQS